MPKLAPGLSLWALNNYLEEDGGVFNNVTLTDKLNLTTCIDTIIEKWGTCDLIISDPRIVVRRTQLFFLKNYDNFDKMAEALLAEYNPIENYDRREDTTEVRDVAEEGSFQNNSSTTSQGSGTSGNTISNSIGGQNVEHQVSAMNSNDYQKRNKDITSARTDSSTSNGTTSESASITGDEAGGNTKTTDDDFTRSSHIHGNIGVTTSQQMIESEIELRKFNIYDYIADLYASEFLYRIW